MGVHEEAGARQLADLPRQELAERDDDAELGVELAQAIHERGVADPFGAQRGNAGPFGGRRHRRRRQPLPAASRPVRLRDRRDHRVRSAEQPLERGHREGRRAEEEEPQNRVAGRTGGRSPAVDHGAPSSRSAFLRFCT